MTGAPRVHGFPPIAAPTARVLILGSMPGRASLAAAAYYAHPRNHFWPIVGAILGFSPDLPYPERADRLTTHGIALWDVLQSCAREGSLDASIRPDTMVPNDFATFFAGHPRVECILFNGTLAETAYKRHAKHNGMRHDRIPSTRLPSTSPANATYTFAEKLAAWRGALVG